MSIDEVMVMFTVVAVLRKVWVCFWALRLIIKGCIVVDCRFGIGFRVRSYFFVFIVREVRFMFWSVRMMGVGLTVVRRFIIVLLGGLGFGSILDVLGIEEIRYKEMFSVGRAF